jgi:hypothetical protein
MQDFGMSGIIDIERINKDKNENEKMYFLMDGRVTGIGKFLRGSSTKMATRLKI